MDAYQIAKDGFLARMRAGCVLSHDMELALVVGFDSGWRRGTSYGYAWGHEDRIEMMSAALSLPQEQP